MDVDVSTKLDELAEIHQVIYELVRGAILGKKPDILNVKSVNWDLLMDISVQHGVMALVWDGICMLPESQQPPRIIRINFGMSAQEIWDRYQKQESVLKEMIHICEQNDMRLLLLKGIGLAENYPKPSSRPCGDVDFYLFGDYEKGNKLFAHHSISFTEKHAEYDFNDVHVENHFSMLDTDTKSRQQIEGYLESTLDSSVRKSTGYYVLSPVANLVYLLMHSVRHFVYTQELPFRGFIDLALFIQSQKKFIITKECRETLQKYDLHKIYDLFIYIGEWLLNIDLDDFHFHCIKGKDLAIFKKFVIEYGFLKYPFINNEKGVFWKRYFYCTRFTSYIPNSYHNYFTYITYRQMVEAVKKTIIKGCN